MCHPYEHILAPPLDSSNTHSTILTIFGFVLSNGVSQVKSKVQLIDLHVMCLSA